MYLLYHKITFTKLLATHLRSINLSSMQQDQTGFEIFKWLLLKLMLSKVYVLKEILTQGCSKNDLRPSVQKWTQSLFVYWKKYGTFRFSFLQEILIHSFICIRSAIIFINQLINHCVTDVAFRIYCSQPHTMASLHLTCLVALFSRFSFASLSLKPWLYTDVPHRKIALLKTKTFASVAHVALILSWTKQQHRQWLPKL